MHSILSRAAIPALTLCLGAALASIPGVAQADSDHETGPLADTHAPAGVMFDHIHKAGEFMIQPVGEDVNGYQLERDGTLWANASIAF